MELELTTTEACDRRMNGRKVRWKGSQKFITVLLVNLVCFVLIFPIQIRKRERERERDCGCQSIVSDLFSCEFLDCNTTGSLLIVRYLLLL